MQAILVSGRCALTPETFQFLSKTFAFVLALFKSKQTAHKLTK